MKALAALERLHRWRGSDVSSACGCWAVSRTVIVEGELRSHGSRPVPAAALPGCGGSHRAAFARSGPEKNNEAVLCATLQLKVKLFIDRCACACARPCRTTARALSMLASRCYQVEATRSKHLAARPTDTLAAPCSRRAARPVSACLNETDGGPLRRGRTNGGPCPRPRCGPCPQRRRHAWAVV